MLRKLFVVLLLSAPALAADDTYTLKLYKSVSGDKFEVEKSDETKGTVTIDIQGQKNKMPITASKREVYTEEVLEKKAEDRFPTKSRRTYTTSVKSTPKAKDEKALYDGETVMIEKKGDQFEFTIGKKKLSEDEAGDLFKSFNKKKPSPTNEELLPEKPVKIGDTWTVSEKKLEKLFDSFDEKMIVDPKKSKISGKLVKAFKKDSAQYGTLEFTIELALTELELEGMKFPVKEGGKSVLVATVEVCIDGTVGGEVGSFKLDQELVVELPNNNSLTISGKTTGKEVSKQIKK